MNTTLDWVSFATSAVLLMGYEARVLVQGQQHPEHVARMAHAQLRARWVEALSRTTGSEITAVQALRNSLMSAMISASTAALALMGTVSLAAQSRLHPGPDQVPPLRLVLDVLLAGVLFASYVCSAMAMRYFNHAGYVMSMPTGCEERKQVNPVALAYVSRAGLLYGWGLRGFLLVAPLVAGLVEPLLMLPTTLVLLVVLRWSDRPAEWLRNGGVPGGTL